MSALTAFALADMMRQAQCDPVFRAKLIRAGIPFGALASTLEKADAACAERANAIASAHDATLRAQRLHEERTALAARVERLEAQNAELCLDVAGHNFVRNERDRLLVVIESAHDALTYPGAEHHEQITVALGILGNAMAARRTALSPQAEKLEKEGV